MDDPTSYDSTMFPSQARLHSTAMVAINAETNLAELGITLPDGCIGIEFRLESDSILRFDFVSAGAAKGGIAQFDRFPVWDTKSRLETLKFYTGEADINVSFFIWVAGNE